MTLYSNFEQNMIDSFINISTLYPAQEYQKGNELKKPEKGLLTTVIGKMHRISGQILFAFKAPNQEPNDDEIVADITFYKIDRRCFARQNLLKKHYGSDREVYELFILDRVLIANITVTKEIKDFEAEIENAKKKANVHFYNKNNPTFFETVLEECKLLMNGY